MIEYDIYVLLETEEEYHEFFECYYDRIPDKMPEKFPAVMRFDEWEERNFRSNKWHCFEGYDKSMIEKIKKDIKSNQRKIRMIKKILKRG